MKVLFTIIFAGFLCITALANNGNETAFQLSGSESSYIPDSIPNPDLTATSVYSYLPDVDVCAGLINYPIIVDHFTQISSLSLTIDFNSQYITYSGYENPNPVLSNGTLLVNSSNSKIEIGWFSVSPVTISMDTLLELKLQASTGSSEITWDLLTPGACYYTDIYGNGLNSIYYSGSIHTLSLPEAPSSISGTSTICQGASAVFSAGMALNADSYAWSVPAGATIIAGENTNTITVLFSSSAVSGDICASGVNSCGASTLMQCKSITISPLPAVAGAISGPATVCQGQTTAVYSVGAISNANSYSWTLPANATITSGGTTNTITVNYGVTAESGNITVKGMNTCGFGVSSTFSVVTNPLPGTTGPISGSSTVCQGQSGVEYTVGATSNCTTYSWTVPPSATIISGSSTNSIMVNFGIIATSGLVTVKGVNNCGNGNSSSFPVVVNPLPGNAGIISGPSTFCQGQSGVVYSVSAIPNASSYVWTIPANATIASGASSNSITVNYGNASSSGYVTVKGMNSCGSGNIAYLLASSNSLPGVPGVITGASTVCQGATVNYSIGTMTNTSTYSWTVPPNASIVSGASTNSISVYYGNNSTTGLVTVKGVNSCGNGVSNSLSVIVNPLPAAPATILGSPTVCQGQTSVFYSVAAINYATSYTWTVPLNATITSGSTTNSITVNYANNASSGFINVKGVNGCGIGTTNSIPITINPKPGTPGNIYGSITVCQGQPNVEYSIDTILNATSYLWTLPSNCTFAYGNSDKSIVVNFGNEASNGSISVKGVNGCGSGLSNSQPIYVNPLPGSAGYISGTSVACQGSTSNYFSGLISNAINYVWTVPAGATILSGANTNVITVSFSSSAVSGDICVTGMNACGNSLTTLCKPVTINPLPNTAGTIYGQTVVCQGQTGVEYSIGAIPNASVYSWTVPNNATITSGASGNSIIVNYGNTASTGSITAKGINACGNGIGNSVAIESNQLPGAAGTISGPTTFCQGQTSVEYSVGTIPYATSYSWTVPTNATITAGATTNSITVNYGNNSSNGNVIVKGVNSCGNGTSNSLSVTSNPLPGSAGLISGQSIVCQGTTATYSVSTILNANSYTWTVPAGTTIISGASTNTITLSFSTSALSGDICVAGTNPCGNSLSQFCKSITVSPIPGEAGAISGLSAVCQGHGGVVYSLAPITNASSYSWSVPVNATITTGATSNSIIVNYADNAVSGSVTAKGINSCGNGISNSLSIIVNPLPVAAGAISGQTTVCQGQTSVIYTVGAIPHATSYIWTVPANASIVSGGTSNSITVDYGITASSGLLTVKGVNSCGNGIASSLPVTANLLPNAAGTITGESNVCIGSSVTYSVQDITNASSFSWTVPYGATITSGASSNTISVSFTSAAINGEICVNGLNACGASSTKLCKTIEIKPKPDNAGEISGLNSVCQGQGEVVYSVEAINNATSYVWTVPSNVLITSSDTTNIIVLNYGNNASSGNIIVTGANECGLGSSNSLYVVTNPCSIIQGTLTYDNNFSSPISATPVYLSRNNEVVQHFTDNLGHFEFKNVGVGSYFLSVDISKPWGGVNSIDALLMLKHFVHFTNLVNLKVKAADIDGTGFINSSDALVATRRFVQLISSFVVGNWFSTSSLISVTGTYTITSNLKGICYGDVDGSYIPSLKAEPDINLQMEGEKIITSTEQVEIPFTIDQTTDIGAVSLVMQLSKAITKLKNVELNQNGELVYNVIGNEARISWYSLIPLQLNAGDVLFKIVADIDADILNLNEAPLFEFLPESQLGDPNGIPIHGVSLKYPHLSLKQSSPWLNENTPNPFSSDTKISYVIPENSYVKLELLNFVGQEVAVLEEGMQQAGNHSHTLSGDLLKDGIYFCKIVVTSNSQQYTQTRKMILSK